MSHTKEPVKVALEGSEEQIAHIAKSVNACANLPEPEKNIRELVEWAGKAIGLLYKSGLVNHSAEGVKAIRPFREIKNERPLD